MVRINQKGYDFPSGSFKDWYGHECKITLSSIADDRCIWLGRIGTGGNHMMHLSVADVMELLPVLQRFIETGDIIERD